MPASFKTHASSYRDPSGFIFKKEEILYRQVNKIFKDDFDHFINSGCYQLFAEKGWLIPHETIPENLTNTEEWYLTLKPAFIPFISYPYEWSFDMLKDAALLTLNLLKESLKYGLILKDATPFNIQFLGNSPVFIDTLSFEKYEEQEPWIAYRQFCECFLSPLLLSSYSKQPLQQLMLAYPEGIPLAITRSLLPWRSKFSLHTYLHIHLHAGIAEKSKGEKGKKIIFTRRKLQNLISSLEGLVNTLTLKPRSTAWSAYYDEASQRKDYLLNKKEIINEWIDKTDNIKTAADLGSNDGEFSFLLANKNMQTIAGDFDPQCINNLYNRLKDKKTPYILPLIIDIANPSPAIGVNNEERTAFTSRLNADLTLALALIHHLAIGRNIPFDLIARFFQHVTHQLIIEFIPKEDEKVQGMLTGKKDIYTAYSVTEFEKAFTKYFKIVDTKAITGSGRVLYRMTKNEN